MRSDLYKELNSCREDTRHSELLKVLLSHKIIQIHTVHWSNSSYNVLMCVDNDCWLWYSGRTLVSDQ